MHASGSASCLRSGASVFLATLRNRAARRFQRKHRQMRPRSRPMWVWRIQERCRGPWDRERSEKDPLTKPSQIPQMILLMGLWIKRTGRWEKKPLIPDRTSSMMRSPQAKISGARTQPDKQRMKSRERQQPLWKGLSVQFSRTWPAASLHLKPERLS